MHMLHTSLKTVYHRPSSLGVCHKARLEPRAVWAALRCAVRIDALASGQRGVLRIAIGGGQRRRRSGAEETQLLDDYGKKCSVA